MLDADNWPANQNTDHYKDLTLDFCELRGSLALPCLFFDCLKILGIVSYEQIKYK